MEDGDRLWSRVRRRSFLQCWDWEGAKGLDGRGEVKWGGRVISAARALLMSNGVELSPLEFVIRTCSKIDCMNPEHLGVKDTRLWEPHEPGVFMDYGGWVAYVPSPQGIVRVGPYRREKDAVIRLETATW